MINELLQEKAVLKTYKQAIIRLKHRRKTFWKTEKQDNMYDLYTGW